ncbi:hypothetical protein ABGT24_24490 [Peribacillus frigoritolerans]
MEHSIHTGNHNHRHSIACEHTKIRHDDHIDYVHNGHCDDHGPVEIVTIN